MAFIYEKSSIFFGKDLSLFENQLNSSRPFRITAGYRLCDPHLAREKRHVLREKRRGLQVARQCGTGLSESQDRGSRDPSDLSPSFRPGPKPRLPVHAGILCGMADETEAGAASLRGRRPGRSQKRASRHRQSGRCLENDPEEGPSSRDGGRTARPDVWRAARRPGNAGQKRDAGGKGEGHALFHAD